MVIVKGMGDQFFRIDQPGKELAIFSSRLNANKFPVVIDWLEKGLIDPEKLIFSGSISPFSSQSMTTGNLLALRREEKIASSLPVIPYHHVTDAIELFEKDQRQCCKVLLTFGQ
jgi:L-gulonate 5-dehydrogenase